MFRKIRILATLGILAAGSVWIAKEWRIYHRVPKNYEWNELDRWMKANAGPDDLVLFEPGWLSGYAQDLGRLRPYSVVTQREIFQKAFPPSSRLWLISLFQNSSLAPRLKGAGFMLEDSRPLASLQIHSYSVSPGNPSYRFLDYLAEAEVFIDYGDHEIQKAEWKQNTWVFSDNPAPWNQVSVHTEAFRNQMRRCLWFHPIETGVKAISFSNVPLGKSIRLWGGIVDSGLRTPPGSPVTLFVRIGKERVKALEYKDTDVSFDNSVDTQPFEGTNQPVTFEVQTAEQTQRHFCFSAWSES